MKDKTKLGSGSRGYDQPPLFVLLKLLTKKQRRRKTKYLRITYGHLLQDTVITRDKTSKAKTSVRQLNVCFRTLSVILTPDAFGSDQRPELRRQKALHR